jgi:hypothetical protein
MDQSLYMNITQLNLAVGVMAFITTTLHVTLSFPLFSYVIVRNKYPGTKFLMTSFITGFATYGLWLIYVWPYQNLFMITALSLLMLSHLIFLIQTLIQGRGGGDHTFRMN